MRVRRLLAVAATCLLALGQLTGCKQKQKTAANQEALFQLVPAAQSQVTFRNDLIEDELTNVLVYEYTYNGGGVALGDVNGDNLDDIYFTANKGANKLYLNKGNLRFEDVTRAAGVELPLGWKTGVTLVDLNADNRLDFYVCRSGDLPGQLRQNQLFINLGNDHRGIPRFREQAAACGLADSAYSTQAAFFDYDQDRDLDMLLLNHSPRRFEHLDEFYIKQLLRTPDAQTGIKLYRNEGAREGLPHFREVATAAGLLNTRLTFALGASVADLNNDGWPDIYLSNDYLAPDYLYINNHDGTFTDQLGQQMGHTSLSSMGNDAADLNNDGYADVCTLDMLPADNRRQKLLFASDNYELFRTRDEAGLHKQYMRNMLHVNNGNNTFSEIGQLAGISNTDWSWAPLLADYDNDGWKDLFLTNGFLHDYTNLDFLKYMGDFLHDRQGDVQRKNLLDLVRQMPSSNVVGYAFRNAGGTSFTDVSTEWGITEPANSNGAAYADLDNDGDLDVVVNNLNGPAFLYRNTAEKRKNRGLAVRLEGQGANRLGIGTKVTLYGDGKVQTQEQLVGRGYQSSVSPVLHFGLGSQRQIDSVRVVWPGGRQQVVRAVPVGQPLVLRETTANVPLSPAKRLARPVFAAVAPPIAVVAAENNVNDFKRQPLLVNSLSYSGPCLVQADVNGDKQPDLFMGGASGHMSHLYVQNKAGKLVELPQPALEADYLHEDTDAAFLDVDGDGDMDLYVASGGYDNFLPGDALLQDRLYVNDGRGNFTKSPAGSLPAMPTSTGCVRVADVNGDKAPDLFVGGRVTPGRYPESPTSYLLLNDGHGRFRDQAASLAPSLQQVGMVTDAAWVDVNQDQHPDLVTVGEWLPVQVWINHNGRLTDQTTTYLPGKLAGWWNKLLVADLNNDNRPDLVIGNMGLNTQCRASTRQPAELYYKDFDDNGAVDPILCMYQQGKSYPFVSRDELLDQLSIMRPRFPDYKSYADAQLKDIFLAAELEGAKVLRATHLQTTCLLSTPQTKYRVAPLPVEAQYTPIFALAALDYNHDNCPDLLLGGNAAHSRIRFGNHDAGYGLLLRGDGRGNFTTVPQPESGLRVLGDVRSFTQLGEVLLIGRNNQAIQAYTQPKP